MIARMASPLADFRKIVFANTLRGCQIFTGLPSEDLDFISSFVVPKELAKGEYLFHEGSASEGFYVVQRGAVNVHRVSANGKEQVISVFRTGQSFAEAALASPGGYPADARAIEDSTILLVPKADILGLLRNRPELALRMLGSMSQHLRVIVGLLDDLTLKDVGTRLANWLLKRCPSATASRRRRNPTRPNQARARRRDRHRERNPLTNLSGFPREEADSRRGQIDHDSGSATA
jgi:CRP/FNR family transcriptional regulator